MIGFLHINPLEKGFIHRKMLRLSKTLLQLPLGHTSSGILGTYT